MDRRDFLKFSGLFSVTLFMQLNPLGKAIYLPGEAQSQGVSYRGTADGRIYVSMNGGKDWLLHTNFGSAYSILRLAGDRAGQVYAQLGFGGRSFEIVLASNGKAWRTM